ncbi:MAG TPA: hypothetical protein ENJ37_05710 [Deltaproteobacteria bacterium]|nr:hypothetical protein [Deltaproteobacteria bacterium]
MMDMKMERKGITGVWLSRLMAAFVAVAVFSGAALGLEWEPLGPYGGIVTTVVEDRDGTLYLGTDGGGVFKSTDGGESWRLSSKGLGNPSVFRLTISEKGYIFAGTKGGLYWSRDGAATWSPVAEPSRNALVPDIFVDKDGRVYISVWGSGVFRSDDGGESWTWLKEGLSAPQVNQIAADEDTLYAATDYGIYRRPKGDDGKWESFGYSEENVVSSVIVDPKGDLYCSYWAASINKWIDGEFMPYIGVDPYTRVLTTDGEGNIYAGAETGVYRLQSTARVGERIGLEKTDVQSVMVSRGGRFFVGSYRSGLYVKEGSRWVERNKGIVNFEVLALALTPEGDIYVGTMGGLFRRDPGGRWESYLDLNNEDVNTIVFTENGYILAGTDHAIFRKVVGSSQWKKFRGLWGFRVKAIVEDRDGSLYMGTDGDGVLVSRDGGNRWDELNEGLENRRVTTLIFAGGVLLAATHDGVFRLEGGKWVRSGLDWKTVNDMAAHRGRLYAATAWAGVFVSADGGRTWSAASEGLETKEHKRVNTIESGPDGNLYIGTFDGLLRSDGKGPWRDITGELVNRRIRAVSFDKEGRIYIGTFGAGVSSAVLE